MAETPTDEPDAFPEALWDDILVALACMAGRSKRSQADVGAAMNGACLAPVPPGRVARALEGLERGGFVEDALRLSDGGILIRVTPAGKMRARALLARQRLPVLPHPEMQ